jgi:hypothetical protein
MDHYSILIVLSYWVFSAIVGGMPEPEKRDGRGYCWLYKSLHILAGNMTTALARYYPQGSVIAESTQSVTITPETK